MDYKIYEDDNLKEKIYHTLSNKGLNIYYMPKPGYRKQHAIITVDVGSDVTKFKQKGDEKYSVVPNGIAHFLEHKMFEGEDGDLFDEYSKLGMDSNAYTGHRETSYLFTSTNDFYEGLELLVGLVEKPFFTKETVENEKGIIGQEIKMYEDDPYSVCFNNLLESMYIENSVKEDIAGSVETVNATSYEDLLLFHRSFYNNNSMVLFVIGDLDFDKIVAKVNEVESGYDERPIVERFTYDEPAKIVKNKHVDYMNIENPICYIGFKDVNIPKSRKEKVRRDLIMELVLESIFGNSSDFYSELYNEGLIDLNFGSSYSIGDGYGHSIILSQTDKPEELFEKIINFIKKDFDSKFNESDFNRIKNKTIGQHVMAFNSIENIAGMFTSFHFDDTSIFDINEIIKSIDYEEAKDVSKEVLNSDLASLSIIYPSEFKEGSNESSSI